MENNKKICKECEHFEQCEVKIILHNSTSNEYEINKGDKIAQIMLKEHKTYLMGINTEEERNGGFGSTGE